MEVKGQIKQPVISPFAMYIGNRRWFAIKINLSDIMSKYTCYQGFAHHSTLETDSA